MTDATEHHAAKPPTVPGIRTRLHVQVDRMKAGLPFYANLKGFYPIGDELQFLGTPCWIIDRDGDHAVLQAKETP